MTASISHGVQAIGLACIPIEDMPADSVALARKPVAAAVLTLRTRDDGHPELVATRLSDARDTEFPLPWLIDQALMPGMVKLISAEDRHVLAGDTMARRYFVEERLAALCRGTDVVDPGSLPDAGVSDEAALWKRLEIPFGRVDDRAVKRCWSRGAPGVAEDIALGTAVARLMTWAHRAGFDAAEPEAFFETMIALRDWAAIEAERMPSLRLLDRSRPVRRASSFIHAYRDYRARRDAGDAEPMWTSFEDGLFHT